VVEKAPLGLAVKVPRRTGALKIVACSEALAGQFAPVSVSAWPATNELDDRLNDGVRVAVVDVELVDELLVEDDDVLDVLEDEELELLDDEELVIVSVTAQQNAWPSGASSVIPL
jgi:hypothetical protein